MTKLTTEKHYFCLVNYFFMASGATILRTAEHEYVGRNYENVAKSSLKQIVSLTIQHS